MANDQNNVNAIDLDKAADAIAELIAADREYDEAKVSLQAISDVQTAFPYAVWSALNGKAEKRLETATARRASALAALEGK